MLGRHGRKCLFMVRLRKSYEILETRRPSVTHAAKVLLPALVVTALAAACGPALLPAFPTAGSVAATATLTPAASRPDATVMVGAGDIAYDGPGAEATAKLLDRIPGTVFNLGDNAYTTGSPKEFATYYAPTWGRHLERTRPTVGNHEYRTPGAAGYYAYFGAKAGDPTKGYYSYDVNADWHVVVVNSAVGGSDNPSKDLGPSSAQYQWISADLDQHRGQNVIAMWHHPTFSSGEHGDQDETQALWSLMVAKGVDITLWGHDHHYERFVPMDAKGKQDDAHGVRAFVVGTGGKSHYHFLKFAKKTTAVRNADTFGVLKLTLGKQSYDWEFVPEAGKSFTDKGTGTVH